MHLELKNIHKSFGKHHVLKGISLEAESGHAFGYLGRNGAGKTTTIRILMDVFRADAGEILLDGKPLRESPVSIGYLPEEKGLYPKSSLLRQMCYLGELRGLSSREARNAALSWLERLGMMELKDHKLDTLSKGNQQKIQLAVALITKPSLIVLDEPFSGLDPVNAKMLKDIVTEEVQAGNLVFFSSHQMSYVESFCEDIALLKDGEVVVQGKIRDIRARWPRDRYEVRLHQENQLLSPKECTELLRRLAAGGKIGNEVTAIEEGQTGAILQLSQASDDRQLLQELVSQSLGIDHFAVLEPSLEEIFVHYSGDEKEAQGGAANEVTKK